MKKTNIQPNKEESGVALIVVMCMLVLIAVLVASTVSMSQSIRLASTTTTQMNKSVYLDESAAAKAVWLLQYDIINNTSRNIGEDTSTQTTTTYSSTEERFMADGREHIIEVNGVKMSVTIYDMVSGITIYDSNSISNLDYLTYNINTDSDTVQALDELKDKLTDYIDSDDYVSTYGMESSGYTAEEMANLPRNEEPYFREELLWIPGFSDFYGPNDNGALTEINLIAPPGLNTPRGNPNIMSASLEYIRVLCDFEDSDFEIVEQALKDFKADPDLTFDDVFSSKADLLSTLKQNFSFSESGYYTILVRPAKSSGLPGRLLSISLRVGSSLSNDGIQFYSWQLY